MAIYAGLLVAFRIFLMNHLGYIIQLDIGAIHFKLMRETIDNKAFIINIRFKVQEEKTLPTGIVVYQKTIRKFFERILDCYDGVVVSNFV